MLAEMLLVQLQKSAKLKTDVDKWRRYPTGHKKKTYKFLLEAMDRVLLLEKEDRNRAFMVQSLGGKSTPALPSPSTTPETKACYF